MKLISLTSISRADCFGIDLLQLPRGRRPSESTTGDDDVPGHAPNVALCNNVLQSAQTAHRYERYRALSDAELLPDQAVDLAAVGAALGLLHHGADDGADRLAVAGADLLGGLGVGLDRGGDDRLQLAVVGDIWARPSRSTIAAGSPPSATSAASTVLPLPWEIFFSWTRPIRAARASGSTLESAAADLLLRPGAAPRRARRSPSWRRPSARPRRGAGGRARSRRRSRGRRRAGWRRRSARPIAYVALDPRRRQLRQRLAGLAQHRLGRRQRHQVGLGEVAVVVRFLLRAQRGQAAAGRVEVEGLLLDRPPRVDQLALALQLGFDPALRGSGSCSCSSARSSSRAPRCRPGAPRRWRRPAGSPPPCSRRRRRAGAPSRAAAAPTRRPRRRRAGRAR